MKQQTMLVYLITDCNQGTDLRVCSAAIQPVWWESYNGPTPGQQPRRSSYDRLMTQLEVYQQSFLLETVLRNKKQFSKMRLYK